MSDISKNLAKNLENLRKIKKISQEKLSQMSSIPRSTLAHMESGAGNPTN